jgi:aryl-alcohol dehydrogenase-like predicted oxidoreductase
VPLGSGTRNPEHLDSNVAAVEVSLVAEDLRRIDEMAP